MLKFFAIIKGALFFPILGIPIVVILLIATMGSLLQGCYTPEQTSQPVKTLSQTDARVDFNDPVLNRRQVFLFGLIDQRAAEQTIQKLHYLDGKGYAPIDLYLQTPGGEIRHAMAIDQTMRLLKSPVNCHALSECNSAGVMVLAAGTGKRSVFHGSVIVVNGMAIHGKPPLGYTEQVQETYTQFWRKRARFPDSWLPLPPGVFHVLSAEQALEYGIVDEVIGK